MNQEKIGKFIAELRKEKNMTQKYLANKLGITDRAISKWENGRGLPDLSLLTPLSEILDISINELLSGEKLNKEKYQQKLEENIINTINYTDKKAKKSQKVFITIITIILLFIFTIITLFCIDINRMRNNKPVFFSTWGYKYAPAIDFKDEEIELAIKEYLVSKGDSEEKHHDNEKTFASMRVYLFEEKENHELYHVYAWVNVGKYYLENEEIKEGSISSIPYKFIVEKQNDEFVVVYSRIPRDGSYYKDDMKNIFPRSVRNDMKDFYIDGTNERLQMDIEEQTKLYFHK